MSSSAPEQPPVTGHPTIDAALASLDLTGPVSAHAEAVSTVHAALQQVLNPVADAAQR
ncbi:hypothetical protein [Micropruina sp.]|uniref:hypothetical protein n=1 Tax=Micropruina sp. TaxID=2737536 RepID=UPI0039E2BC54